MKRFLKTVLAASVIAFSAGITSSAIMYRLILNT